MGLIVQKYGGTSVGTVERINAVADRVNRWVNKGHQIIVVVSAMSGETNRLIDLCKQVSPNPSAREVDVVITTGEQVTIGLLSIALQKRGLDAVSLTGWQVPIVTDQASGKARIDRIDEVRLRQYLDEGKVVVVAGFQGVDPEFNITTLGRGGSDTTAVAIAAAVKADECQIYTDVDGVYTTDPRVVDTARRMPRVTFEEMLEMASLGSKVLQIRSVEFAGKYGVPLRVLSSFSDSDDDEGTLIVVDEETESMENPVISGIAFNRDEAKLTVRGVPDKPGVAYQILGPIGDALIDVDMILQNVSDDGTTDFTFTVHRNDFARARDLLLQIAKTLDARDILADDTIAKVSLVGVGMRSHAGVASLMFKILAQESINIQMISTSEIKISVVIDQRYLELAVRALHSGFGLDQPGNPNNNWS